MSCRTQPQKAAVTQPEERMAGPSRAPSPAALTPTSARAPPPAPGSGVKHSPPATKMNANASQVDANPYPVSEANEIKTTSTTIIDTATLIAYIDSKFESLKADWQIQLTQAVQSFDTKLQSMTQTLADYDLRLDEYQNRIDATIESYEAKLTEVHNKYDLLTAELDMYKSKYDDMDQVNRQCNIEIQNVPEDKNENVLNIVCNLSDALNVPIPMEQVRSAHRVRARAHSDRPRNIIVQLGTRSLRDDIIAAARVRRGLTAESLKIAGAAQRVYVNEHLTLRNKILYAKVRKVQSEKNYQFVWVRNGNIYARKMAGAKYLLIKNEKDMLKM